MLFNSNVFLFGFLPLVLAGFYLLAYLGGRRFLLTWIILASLVFYGWWSLRHLALLLLSLAVNYALLHLVSRAVQGGRLGRARAWLVLGIAFDLGLLAYFKYAHFFLASTGLEGAFTLGDVVLPIGISFYTFQQIAYLVDVEKGRAPVYRLDRFAGFIAFFPQLIAGPIVLWRELVPQLEDLGRHRLTAQNVALGLTILTIGLFKKVGIADTAALFSTPVFQAVAGGAAVGLRDAWLAALSFTLQLYFDFSGYSDMAIGLALLFGIRLPINFASPYKAGSIRVFWRTWHVTLSRFLRDYLYIPLGGSRQGAVGTAGALFLTMVLGGLWHGAGWTFVVWGAFHGLLLILNHLADRQLRRRERLRSRLRPLLAVTGWPVTFLLVVVGWVFFRAADLQTAFSLLASMAGAGPAEPGFATAAPALGWGLVLALLLAVRLLPNTQELTGYETLAGPDETGLARHPAAGRAGLALRWRPTAAWATAMAVCALLCVVLLNRTTEFLYFQF